MPHHARLIGKLIYENCPAAATPSYAKLWSLKAEKLVNQVENPAQAHEERKVVFVGGYLLLRLVCPYLIKDLFNLLPVDEDTTPKNCCKRNLIIISRLIQCVSNKS